MKPVEALTKSKDPDLAADARKWIEDNDSAVCSNQDLRDRMMELICRWSKSEDKEITGWRKSWEEEEIDETDVASSSKDPCGKGKGGRD